MATIRQPIKRTESVQTLHKTQMNNLKVSFKKLSKKQDSFKGNLKELIISIFKNYKNNNFENNKNLNLLNSYLLMKNISKKDGNFIKLIANNKDLIISNIDQMFEDVLTIENIGEDVYKLIQQKYSTDGSKEKIFAGIKTIFSQVVTDYLKTEKTSTETKGDAKTTLNLAKKILLKADKENENVIESEFNDKIIESEDLHIITDNNIKNFKTELFGGLLTAFKTIKPKTSQTHSAPIITNTISQFKFFDNTKQQFEKANNVNVVDKIDTKNVSKDKQLEKDVQKEYLKKQKSKNLFMLMQNSLTETTDRVSKSMNKSMNQISIKTGRISAGLKINDAASGILGLFKRDKIGIGSITKGIGTSLLRGGFLLFNIGAFITKGIFGIGKFVVKGILGFAKGIVKITANVTSFIFKKIGKPILKGILKLIQNPAGAFVVGYMAHMIHDGVVNFIKPIYNNIKDKKFFQKIQKGTFDIFSKISKFIKEVNMTKVKGYVMKVKEFLASSQLSDIIANIVQMFTPEKLLTTAISFIAGKTMWRFAEGLVGKGLKALWRARGLIGRGITSLARQGISLVGKVAGSTLGVSALSIGAMVGGFAWIIHSANKTMKLYHKADERRQTGENLFNRGGKKSFSDINDNFRRAGKSTIFRFDDQIMKTKGVSENAMGMIRQAIENSTEDSEKTQTYKKIMERVKQDSLDIDAEYQSIKRSIDQYEKELENDEKANIPVDASFTKLGIVTKEGGKLTECRDVVKLGISKEDFYKFRMMYFLIRSELLKRFSNGQIKDENGRVSEEEYNKLIGEILVKKGDSWEINKKFLSGDQAIQFKGVDLTNFSKGSLVSGLGNDATYFGKDVSTQSVQSMRGSNLLGIKQTLHYTYHDQLQNAGGDIEEHIIDTELTTRAQEVFNLKLQRIVAMYCDQKIDLNFNTIQSADSLYGLTIKLIFAPRTQKYLKEKYKYTFHEEMPDITSYSGKRLQEFKDFFIKLFRYNTNFSKMFNDLIIECFGDSIFNRMNIQPIAIKPGQKKVLFIEYSNLTGDAWNKPNFQSLADLGIEESKINEYGYFIKEFHNTQSYQTHTVDFKEIKEMKKQLKTPAYKKFIKQLNYYKNSTQHFDSNYEVDLATSIPSDKKRTFHYLTPDGDFGTGRYFRVFEAQFSKWGKDRLFNNAADEISKFFLGFLRAFLFLETQEEKEEEMYTTFGSQDQNQNDAQAAITRLQEYTNRFVSSMQESFGESGGSFQQTMRDADKWQQRRDEEIQRLQTMSEQINAQEQITQETIKMIEENIEQNNLQSDGQTVDSVEIPDDENDDILENARKKSR